MMACEVMEQNAGLNRMPGLLVCEEIALDKVTRHFFSIDFFPLFKY